MKRSSGILLHIVSLPGNFGIGSLGKNAFDFVDFLHKSGQKLWQICPLSPTGYGNSPYSSVPFCRWIILVPGLFFSNSSQSSFNSGLFAGSIWCHRCILVMFSSCLHEIIKSINKNIKLILFIILPPIL